jgi:hypothetical protein
VAGHADMRAGHQRRPKQLAPVVKKTLQGLFLRGSENGEPRERIPLAPADAGRKTPHSSLTRPELGDFFSGELQHPVGRIGTNRVDGLRRPAAQPLKTIRMENLAHQFANETSEV